MVRILLVDDSATDRRLAGGLLERGIDCEIVYARDGSEALTLVGQEVFELVVTDLNMPEIDGLELTGRLRKQRPTLPVILMTARGSEEIAVLALQQGAASYVPKRLLSTELVPTVQQVLSLSRQELMRDRLFDQMTRQQLEFRLENDPELIGSLVRMLQDLAAQIGLCPSNESVRFGVALQEALTNACYHGNLEVSSTLREVDHRKYYELARERMGEAPFARRRILVQATFTPEVGEFVVEDEGAGFDPATVPDPTDVANLERPSGRGLLLMRTFMDQVQFEERGNRVRMWKRRGADGNGASAHGKSAGGPGAGRPSLPGMRDPE